MLIKKLHKYLLLFLMGLYACRSEIFQSDKIYFSSVTNTTSFSKFSGVSLSRCIYECKIRLRCDGISYSSMFKLCSLINEPLFSNKEDSKKGFIQGRTADWDMVNI